MKSTDRLDLSPLLTDWQKLLVDRLTLSQVHHQRSQILQGWMAEYGVPPSECCLVELDLTGNPARRTIVSARTEQELAVNCRRLLEAATRLHVLQARFYAGRPLPIGLEHQIYAAHQELGLAVLSCMPGSKGQP